MSFRLSGAGGYGPPEKRDRAAIADDIADGYVTREAAQRDYGWMSNAAEPLTER